MSVLLLSTLHPSFKHVGAATVHPFPGLGELQTEGEPQDTTTTASTNNGLDQESGEDVIPPQPPALDHGSGEDTDEDIVPPQPPTTDHDSGQIIDEDINPPPPASPLPTPLPEFITPGGQSFQPVTLGEVHPQPPMFMCFEDKCDPSCGTNSFIQRTCPTCSQLGCGNIIDIDQNTHCSCDSRCLIYGDCCSDFSEVCLQVGMLYLVLRQITGMFSMFV